MLPDLVTERRAFGGAAQFLGWNTPFLNRLRTILIDDLIRRNPPYVFAELAVDLYEVIAPGPDDETMACVYVWRDGWFAMVVSDEIINIALELQ